MDLSKSFAIESKKLQLVNHDLKPLTLLDRLKGKSEDIDNLEEVIDLDRDMERYQKDTSRKLKPQLVYQMGIFESRRGLYQKSREVERSVLNDPVDLRIVSKQFENSLRYDGYKYIHQGMYIVEIKGMARKKLGTRVLVTLLDKRWDTIEKAALGFLEGDINENSLITYIAPDLKKKNIKKIMSRAYAALSDFDFSSEDSSSSEEDEKVNYKKKEDDFTGLYLMTKGGSLWNNSDSDSDSDVSDDLTYDGLSSKVHKLEDALCSQDKLHCRVFRENKDLLLKLLPSSRCIVI
jgi:hypothetical protein